VGQGIREICVVSIICSVACNLAPEGIVKRVMRICCCVVLMLIIISPLGEFDMEEYAGAIAKYRELEVQMSQDAENVQSRLNRLVIEEEYKTYIMDKAKEKSISLLDADVELEWNTGGFWVPYEVTLVSWEQEDNISYFSSVIVSELGISEDKILWESPK